MNRVLVIGATGNVGRDEVSQLAATGAQVRAMTRNPASARLPSQVDVMRADLALPESLERCLEGVDAVFLVWTAPPDAVAPVIARIAKYARRVVFLSSPHKTPHPFFQQPNPLKLLHAEIEHLIEASTLDWTFLRPGIFAANSGAWWAEQIRKNDLVRWAHLDVHTAPVHERDLAAVAVRALCKGGHAGREYVLTGPESLTQREQISIIGSVLGRSLTIEEISPEKARREMPMPLPVANMLLNAWAAAAGQPAFVTSTVAEITGAPARTFHEWATDHAAEFHA
jgi:uncharacterized protein YbjT (DUF2867 family)